LDEESCFLAPDNSLTITVIIKHLPDPDSPPVYKPDIESLITLCKNMTSFYEQMVVSPESCFTDVSFQIDGRSLHAHKFMLSSRSEVFAAMFASGMQESKSSIVMLEDVEFDVMQAVIRSVFSILCSESNKKTSASHSEGCLFRSVVLLAIILIHFFSSKGTFTAVRLRRSLRTCPGCL
jgi:hypothetical protein